MDIIMDCQLSTLYFCFLLHCSHLTLAEIPCGRPSPKAENRTKRSVRGDSVNGEQHPWLVGVVRYLPGDRWRGCSGSLITERVVLTAAYCLGDYGEGTAANVVVVDAFKDDDVEPPDIITTHEVVAVKKRGDYDILKENKNNIALLLLAWPWTSSHPDSYPICLSTKSYKDIQLENAGKKLFAYGLGGSKPEEVMATANYRMGSSRKIKIMSSGITCFLFFELFLYTDCLKIEENKCPSRGDVGGPGAFEDNGVYYQLTITSTVHKDACDRGDFDMPFTMIKDHLPFIKEKLEEFKRMVDWESPPREGGHHLASMKYYSTGGSSRISLSFSFEDVKMNPIVNTFFFLLVQHLVEPVYVKT